MLDTVEEEPIEDLDLEAPQDTRDCERSIVSPSRPRFKSADNDSSRPDGMTQRLWKRISSYSTRSSGAGSSISSSTISGFSNGRSAFSEELELPQIRLETKDLGQKISSA